MKPIALFASLLKSRVWIAVLLGVLVSSCASLLLNPLDEQFGPPRIIERGTQDANQLALALQARQVVEQRCAVCHGCYDAPCQLNMQSFEGIERGAHKDKVYNAERLFSAEPSRLFYDAKTTGQWRSKGFFPVLNERAQTADANQMGSLVARMLDLKQTHPLPVTAKGQVVGDFDLSLNRDQQCPTIEEFDAYANRHPDWGMPYALPGLSAWEHSTLKQWVGAGAPRAGDPALTQIQQQQVERVEQFLNGSSNKQRLMTRYIYEHLFLANLYFENDSQRLFFRLVRSRTPSGEPIDLIASRFPYDDPQTDVFYYRLKPVHMTILSKTHQPYALSDARLERWRELFLTPEYRVDELPGYTVEVAANPFAAFQALPVNARYRFLLDDAKTFIEGFIKGPVCRGQVAVDVINDRFWVFFVNPDYAVTDQSGEFLDAQRDALRLPIEEKSDGLNVLTWLKYSAQQKAFVRAKLQYASERLQNTGDVTLDAFWDGDGHNSNAALTVLRHFDNASVVRGLVGTPPKTAWTINYSLFERIHYLLVAGFDVYGNVRHQLYARLYMDFLRMEGEFNFLSALPDDARKAERDFWYRNAVDSVKDFIDWNDETAHINTAIDYATPPQQPLQFKAELFSKLRERLNPALNRQFDWSELADPALMAALERINQAQGRALSFMPELSFLLLDNSDNGNDQRSAAQVFTLMRNSAHSNVTHLFDEQKARLPQEDSLTMVSGVIGSYPNVFFRFARERLPEFAARMLTMRSEQDYQRLLDDFAVRRGDARFWPTSDDFHAAYHQLAGFDFGLVDYNRLENR